MQDFSQPTEGNLDRKAILPGDADSCQWIALRRRESFGERLDSRGRLIQRELTKALLLVFASFLMLRRTVEIDPLQIGCGKPDI
jgi:hypothetical protein